MTENAPARRDPAPLPGELGAGAAPAGAQKRTKKEEVTL